MSEDINKIFEEWKQFLSWCYENNDKTTEIHRDNLERVMTYTRQLENIIKEVREYIENNDLYEQDYDYDYEENLVVGPPSDETARKILLEILDKENK